MYPGMHGPGRKRFQLIISSFLRAETTKKRASQHCLNKTIACVLFSVVKCFRVDHIDGFVLVRPREVTIAGQGKITTAFHVSPATDQS